MPTSTGGASAEDIALQQQMLEKLNDTSDALISIADSLSKQIKSQEKLNKEVEKTTKFYVKELTKSLSASAKDVFTIAENYDAISRGALRSKIVQDQINKATKEYNKAQIAYKLLDEQLAKEKKKLTAEEERKRGDALESMKTQLKVFEDQYEVAKKLEKTAGLTSKIFEGIKDIPFVNKLVDAEKITEAIYENANKTKNSWSAFGAGLSSTFTQIGKKLTDPLILFAAQLAILKKIWDINKELDQTLTDQGRQLGISKEQSYDLYNNAYKYSVAVHDSFVTAGRLVKAGNELNQELGISVDLGEKNKEAFARLTHYYGLSNDAAAKTVELGTEQGKNGMDILKSVAKTYGYQQAQYGNSIKFNKVLEKVSTISSDIYIRFKGNVEEMAKAVMQADRLGLSLEKTAEVGESLLNFEQSIDSELKAELLTGKAINLEKARQYALSGDLTKLNQEIVKQVGGIHEFEKMNVIQRKAYAEAFGMSVQDMSTMLRKQEFEAKLAGSTAKTAKEKLEYATKNGIAIDDQLRAQYEQKSLQDEQHEVFEKLKEVLVKITSGPMKTLFHQFEKILSFVGSIGEKFGALGGTGLGSKLGAALLLLPALVMATKTIRGALPFAPLFTKDVGGMVGGGGMFGGGGGALSTARSKGLSDAQIKAGFGGKAAKDALAAGGGRGLMGRMGGSLGMGLGLGLAGMGINAIADNMDEGGGKTAVSALGGAASGAAMGAIFGPIGMGIGAAAGALWSLYSETKEANAKKEAEERMKKETQEKQDARTQELIESLSLRPINLNVGGKTILDFETATNQYGNTQSILAK